MYRYGTEGGKTIWDSIRNNGVEHIRNNIKQYQLDCDYTEQDALDVASSEKDVAGIFKEAENLTQCGYETRFIKKEEIPHLLGTEKYYGGVLYPHGFGISAYKYCQAMKNVLLKEGVEIYEESPALTIQEHLVTTLHATIKTKYIIICTDRFMPQLKKLVNEMYHVQNFLLVSETLSPDVIQKIFPKKRLMVCDTELVYNFYRMTGERLLVGGGSLWNLYNAQESYHNTHMYKKLTNYIRTTFDLEIQYEQMWPGLIGISKDIAPLAGLDKNSSFIYYIGATTGLPFAAMLGNYCADYLLDGTDTLKDYFSPYRKFPINGVLQKIVGTKMTFALSNWISHINVKHV
jgi:gamma-glutamylputrescine oxidase